MNEQYNNRGVENKLLKNTVFTIELVSIVIYFKSNM